MKCLQHRRRPKSASASYYRPSSSAIPTAIVVRGSLVILMTVLCYQFLVEKELLLKEYYGNGENFNYPYGDTTATAATTTVLEPETTTANHDRDSPSLINGEDSPVLMYIHVGKTGGYTLDSVLRSNCEWYGLKTAKEDCWALYNSINQDPSTQQQQQLPFSQGSHLSHYTRSTMHLDPRRQNARWINEATAFLVSARNPIDRAVSAFDMDHIRNNKKSIHRRPKLKQMRQRFYEECFPTAEKLAQGLVATAADTDTARDNNSSMSMSTTSIDHDDDGDDNDTKEEDEPCSSEYAHQVLTGTSPYDYLNTHLEYNYQFYRDETWGDNNNKDKAIMVVRTEHLWDDVSNLDRQLGGTGNFTNAAQSHYVDHGSSHYLVKSILSPEGRRLFCHALQQEVAIYRELIERAMNLQEWEKKETLDTLRYDCGGELPSVPKV